MINDNNVVLGRFKKKNDALVCVTGWRNPLPCGFACPKQRLSKPEWRAAKSFDQGQKDCNSK